MIRSKINLACPEGHRFFAPRPLYWVGRQCLQHDPNAPANTRGCPHKLELAKKDAP